MHLKSYAIQFPSYLLALCLCLIASTPSEGQRKKKQPKVNPVQVALQLMQTGDYPQAQEYITTQLTAQKKLRRPTCNVDSLHLLSEQMRIAETNIRATQHIVFVDSIVIPKSAVINHLKLNPEMGKISTGKKLADELQLSLTTSGEMGYINALNDNAFLATAHNGINALSRSIRTGNSWSKPELLHIPELDSIPQDYPFLLADGLNLYFSAQAPNGYGGWDIYITRYDTEEKTFLKPQNIGMPFNSDANDYMYYVDESSNTGYFLTDRRQPADSVCLYTFIPNSAHTPYPPGTDFLTLFHAASITCIATTQTGQEARIAQWRAAHDNNRTSATINHRHSFIINNHTVYDNLSQFQNPQAREIARQLLTRYSSRTAQETLLAVLRKQYSKSPTPALHDNILHLELERAQNVTDIKALEHQLRELENLTINGNQ
jgi:hypothetical protein